MILIWLVVGVALTSLAFYLTPESVEIWPSLNAAGLVAAVYLLALMLYSLRKPFSRRSRIVTWVLFALVGTAITISWRTMDKLTHWQRQTLFEIRRTIGDGIMTSQMSDTLLSVLTAYYEQPPTKRHALGAFYRSLYPEIKESQRLVIEKYQDSPPHVYLASLGDDAITLVGQETFVKGRSPDFNNFDGKRGMRQDRATLTEKGVKYESEN